MEEIPQAVRSVMEHEIKRWEEELRKRKLSLEEMERDATTERKQIEFLHSIIQSTSEWLGQHEISKAA
jgi:phytoene/squalene synthetase